VERRARVRTPAAAAVPAKVKALYQCSAGELSAGSGYHMRREDVTNGRQVLEYMTRRAGRCVHVLIVGAFKLTSDERDIAQLAPGGRAQFQDFTVGRERELTIVRDDDGTLRRTYIENGRLTAYGSAAQEWVAALVQEIARESGANAPERVARLRARGGVPAVLAEIEKIESSGSKRRHYEALLAGGTLTPAEIDTVVRHAGRELAESSGDLRAVLRLVPPGGVRAVNGALEEAIARMGDGDKAAVLGSMLDAGDPATLGVVLRLTEQIGSDGDKAGLLQRAAPRVLDGPNDALRDAFFHAYATIGSDGDKASVLLAALRRGRSSASLTRDVLRGASRIGSDGDKASVLLAVAHSRLLTTPELREEYIRAARTIGSDADYRAVIDAVLKG
jgi:hypothetical protein